MGALNGYKYANEAFLPLVRTMIWLFVVLSSLVQGSVTKTVKTELPHFTLELRHDCPLNAASYKQAPNLSDCGTQMIDNDFDGLLYSADIKICGLYNRENKGPFGCWRRVPSS